MALSTSTLTPNTAVSTPDEKSYSIQGCIAQPIQMVQPDDLQREERRCVSNTPVTRELQEYPEEKEGEIQREQHNTVVQVEDPDYMLPLPPCVLFRRQPDDDVSIWECNTPAKPVYHVTFSDLDA
jgi:hypothetical protein